MTTDEVPTLKLFHVEIQQVLYWTYAIEADTKEVAEAMLREGYGDREVVGRRTVHIKVTQSHVPAESCIQKQCYHPVGVALDKPPAVSLDSA
jgi:hypothetical protein